MKIFDKKKPEQNPVLEEQKNETIPRVERPRICSFDIENEINEKLTNDGFNIYQGSLGKNVKVPNYKDYQNHQLLLNFDFPTNLHEYDIFILDLDNEETLEYIPEDHVKKDITGNSYLALLSSYPETLFNPRPLCSYLLNIRLRKITNRRCMMIVFSTSEYTIDYEPIKISSDHPRPQKVERYNIYSFFDQNIPLDSSLQGKEMTLTNMRADLKGILETQLDKSVYNQTFQHPTVWENNKYVKDKKYFPLVLNHNGDIVSYYNKSEHFDLFMFPQIKDKSQFISDFLKSIAPSISPELFPYSTQNSWKEHKLYRLPNEQLLLDERIQIEKDFEKKLNEADKKISKNKAEFSFLHNILSETGDELVDSIIKFFKWLGFENVKDMDKELENSRIKAEDIQIEIENGLLIIEVKGIGGTSTDSECSQISKIKHRRCNERDSFDVYAMYLVNHQRYLPPLKRKNPPFTKEQKGDALNDERGLLSTWQLYKLYFDIQNGILSKQEAKSSIIDYGLIEFKPKNISLLDEPKEFFKDNFVCIVNIKSMEIKIGDEILVERNGQYSKVKIVRIKQNDKQLKQASNGEVGLEFDTQIKKKSRLWKKNSSI